MRPLIVSATMAVLLACDSAPAARDQAAPSSASDRAAVDFLLTSAASDFRSQRAPRPDRFRNVRSGYVTTSDGTRQDRLCGESSRAGEAEWVAFATIKTSGYEQWLGGHARGYCTDASMTWNEQDLSDSLRRRVESLR